MSINIAIFASGTGSNAEEIIKYFSSSSNLHPAQTEDRQNENLSLNEETPGKKRIRVSLIVCNKPGAGVLNIAKKYNIPTILLEKEKFSNGYGYADELKEQHINLIVLAGFLWKVPPALVNAYPGKILNIHPALLPKYGGKGMYGAAVHTAVIASGDQVSGITIHIVDELYDHGHHIFQAFCPVLPGDTPDTLAARIHALEHSNYPKVIEEFAKKIMD